MDLRAISHAPSLPVMGPLSANGPLPTNPARAPHGLVPHSTTPPSITPSPTVSKESNSPATSASDDSELREVFTEFVGQTLFGSMLASMRKTVGKPAYMHGGRTEEVFQQQLDQRIVEDMTKASADSLADPMFRLFTLQRSQ